MVRGLGFVQGLGLFETCLLGRRINVANVAGPSNQPVMWTAALRSSRQIRRSRTPPHARRARLRTRSRSTRLARA
eukprot:scaffold3411_cov396-Prasinococcus_capsulatus_cf.AAC.9